MTAILLLAAAALVAPPIIIWSRRVRRGPAVLRWDHERGRWVAVYRRLR